MKKKEKAKPRSSKLADKASIQNKVFNYYFKETEEKTAEYNKSHNSFVNFCLAQSKLSPNKGDLINKVLDLSYFYDKNFTGNKDFMHIPTFGQVATNLLHYPVLLASRKLENGSNDIIGITTIKYEKHNDLSENPYFPTANENVLSITGVLTQSAAMSQDGNRIYGIGKELYKSSIRAAIKLNQAEPIRLICEIDCRNDKSLNAVTKAVSDLQEEGFDISSYIVGYYEIFNNHNELSEAPTFILEINLNDNKYQNTSAHFSYVHCKANQLYDGLASQIREKVIEKKRYINLVGSSHVIYHAVKPINTKNIQLDIGHSADGNNRKPCLNPVLEYSMSGKTNTNNLALAEQ